MTRKPTSPTRAAVMRSFLKLCLESLVAANAHEHSLSIRQALRKYPYAVLWSLCVSMSIIMEGYDTILIGSLYAYPSYARQFGKPDSMGAYQIPAKWQSAIGSGPQAGAIVGALANGFIIQRFGYRVAFLLGLVLMTAFVFVSFFGMSVQLQAVGQILCGYVCAIFRQSSSSILLSLDLTYTGAFSIQTGSESLILYFQCSVGYLCNNWSRLCFRTVPLVSSPISNGLH
jgi:MFS family permease